MEELTIDLTYGTALFEAAAETKKTELIKGEASELAEVFSREHDLYTFINSPGISAEEKKRVFGKIFEGRICDELLNFLYILIDKGRTMHFDKMVKVYKKLVDRKEGISYGTVYSVIPLDQKRIKELEEQTSELFKVNIKLTNEIDPKLIGGIKILVEGKMIDASIRKRFDDMDSQINLN